MAWSMTPKRRRRALNTLEKGIFASVLGIACLLAPSFSGSSPVLETVAAGLQVPGWFALGVGLALMAVHLALKRRAVQASDLPVVVRNRRAPAKNPGPGSQGAGSWSSEVFDAIEWRRFEAVCEALFAQDGFEVRSRSHGAHGSLDIWLGRANAPEPVAVVHCKHWLARPVGVDEMREFLAVMATHQLQRGSYATRSGYTADAKRFAQDNGIQALDGAALLDLIAKRTPEQQQALLAVAFEGEYWRPTCASCGIKLVNYPAIGGGAAFWGCSNHPRCNFLLPMTAGHALGGIGRGSVHGRPFSRARWMFARHAPGCSRSSGSTSRSRR